MRQALRTSSTSPHRHGSGRKYWSGRKVWHGGVRTSSCASTAVLSAGDSRKHTRRLQEPPTLEDSTSRSTPSSPAPAAARCALPRWSSCTLCLLEPFFFRRPEHSLGNRIRQVHYAARSNAHRWGQRVWFRSKFDDPSQQ